MPADHVRQKKAAVPPNVSGGIVCIELIDRRIRLRIRIIDVVPFDVMDAAFDRTPGPVARNPALPRVQNRAVGALDNAGPMFAPGGPDLIKPARLKAWNACFEIYYYTQLRRQALAGLIRTLCAATARPTLPSLASRGPRREIIVA